MISMNLETIDAAWEELVSLSGPHYAESETLKSFPLDLDWAQYKVLEQAGALYPYVVRDDGKMIGYAWFVMTPSMHNKGKLFAISDGLYLKPDYRHTELSGAIVDAIEEDLIAHGANYVQFSMRPGKEYKSLLTPRGYGPVEIVYGKVVKE